LNAALLPQGLETPDHFLFEVAADDDGPTVGYAWLAIERRLGTVSAYIYNIEIKSEHRRHGHATQALQALESVAAAAGATSIGLNVFAHNTGAQALYRQLGYQLTNMNMRKSLQPESA
jgi:ribosomal protein S18 acetylase RimI-like enzyme